MFLVSGGCVMLRIIRDLLLQRKLLVSKLFNECTFYQAFCRDLKKAKKRVIIESPYLTERRTEYLVPYLQRLVRRGVKVRVNTRHPRCHEGEMRTQAEKAARILLSAGVKIYTYDDQRHWKLALIDNCILWEGSLNILSHSRSREIMRRSQSAYLCRKMIDFVGVYR